MTTDRPLFRAAVVVLALAAGAAITSPSTRVQGHEPQVVREVQIIVDGSYKPNRLVMRQGERVRLKLVRKDGGACTREVVFPKLGIRRELPQNQPVWIDLPSLTPGEYEIKCGMGMTQGTLVVIAQGHP